MYTSVVTCTLLVGDVSSVYCIHLLLPVSYVCMYVYVCTYVRMYVYMYICIDV